MEAKKRAMWIDGMAEMPPKDLSESVTTTGKIQGYPDGDCTV